MTNLRRKPSRGTSSRAASAADHPKQNTPRPRKVSWKTSDTGAAFLLPEGQPVPMDAAGLRQWFHNFESWLLLLRAKFYNDVDGYLGHEGDPCRLPQQMTSDQLGTWERGPECVCDLLPFATIREESPEITPSEAKLLVEAATARQLKLPLAYVH